MHPNDTDGTILKSIIITCQFLLVFLAFLKDETIISLSHSLTPIGKPNIFFLDLPGPYWYLWLRLLGIHLFLLRMEPYKQPDYTVHVVTVKMSLDSFWHKRLCIALKSLNLIHFLYNYCRFKIEWLIDFVIYQSIPH